jgi:hypothetical protein
MSARPTASVRVTAAFFVTPLTRVRLGSAAIKCCLTVTERRHNVNANASHLYILVVPNKAPDRPASDISALMDAGRRGLQGQFLLVFLLTGA